MSADISATPLLKPTAIDLQPYQVDGQPDPLDGFSAMDVSWLGSVISYNRPIHKG